MCALTRMKRGIPASEAASTAETLASPVTRSAEAPAPRRPTVETAAEAPWSSLRGGGESGRVLVTHRARLEMESALERAVPLRLVAVTGTPASRSVLQTRVPTYPLAPNSATTGPDVLLAIEIVDPNSLMSLCALTCNRLYASLLHHRHFGHHLTYCSRSDSIPSRSVEHRSACFRQILIPFVLPLQRRGVL